jgi:hypothetical protein
MQQATQGHFANAKNGAGPLARVAEVETGQLAVLGVFPHTPSRQPEYVSRDTRARLTGCFVLIENAGNLNSSLAIYGALLHEEKVRWASFGAREPLYECGVSGRGSFLASHAFDPLHPVLGAREWHPWSSTMAKHGLRRFTHSGVSALPCESDTSPSRKSRTVYWFS